MSPIRFTPSILLLSVLAGAAPAQVQPGTSPTPIVPPAQPRREVRFAVIGDYGYAGPAVSAVSKLIKDSNVDFIITVGDNNYDIGDAATIDANIGQYFYSYIFPYVGVFGTGGTENRFFPSLGNHDWYTTGAVPYFNFFTLPGNERYYDFRKGPVHFFALDSDPNEPDGVFNNSVQALWLKNGLAASNAPFKIAYFHHAPYSSAAHGNSVWMQWPFEAWGASAVLSGHDHTYERLLKGNLPYVVEGLGGRSLYTFGEIVAGSQFQYNSDYGALLVEASDDVMTFQAVTRTGTVLDTFAISPGQSFSQRTTLVGENAVWKYLDNGTDPGPAWKQGTFNDSSWSSGPAQLGYGDGDEATVVGFGGNPNNKFVTTYFRRQFVVTNPAAFTGFELELLRDDGAVVYLNGVEIFRSNMPAGGIVPSTLASTTVNDFQEMSFYGKTFPSSLLVAGTNTLAVEVHQASITSSDLSFDARLTGLSGGRHLIHAGSLWKYWDLGSEPQGDWKSGAYNDSAWGSGPAQLGYGDGDEATVVGFGPAPSSKYITTWFRKAFDVADASAIRGLRLRTLRDDGVIVYINGREVYRANMPMGVTGPHLLAPIGIGGPAESQWFETSIDRTALRSGRNVIAVEVHQSSPASSDLSFDLELTEFN